MSLQVELRRLLECCLKPSFTFNEVILEEYYGYNAEEKTVFTSVYDILENESLTVFFNKIQENKVIPSSLDRKRAKQILDNFIEIDGYTSHKDLNVNLIRFGLFPFPTLSRSTDIYISKSLDELKVFCRNLLKVDRSEYPYKSKFSSKEQITERRYFKEAIMNFMDEDNYFNFEDLLENSLNKETYINWLGELEELKYFIKRLCIEKKIINPGYLKQWMFTSAYFTLNGSYFTRSRIKDNDKAITRERKDKLDIAIDNLSHSRVLRISPFR